MVGESETILEPTVENIHTVADCVRSGGVVVIPGDTNMVLSTSPEYSRAIRRIYTIKKRDHSKPLSILFHDPADWQRYGRVEHRELMESLVEEFWPGPLNIIVKRTNQVPAYVVGGIDTVCVGSFSVPVWRQVASLVDPLVTTSANISGECDSLVDIETAVEHVGDDVDYILKGERLDWTTQSTTIVDLSSNPTIFREGDIDAHRLNDVADVF